MTSLFQPSFFSAALHPYFFATPFARKCTPFFYQSLTQESFSRSPFRYNFSPFLNKCQLFISKDFWSLPVNPVWRVPGFMKEGKADNEHSNPCFITLAPNFTNICISHLQSLHFQIFFVRSCRDWEKKCRIRIRQHEVLADSRENICFFPLVFTKIKVCVRQKQMYEEVWKNKIFSFSPKIFAKSKRIWCFSQKIKCLDVVHENGAGHFRFNPTSVLLDNHEPENALSTYSF